MKVGQELELQVQHVQVEFVFYHVQFDISRIDEEIMQTYHAYNVSPASLEGTNDELLNISRLRLTC